MIKKNKKRERERAHMEGWGGGGTCMGQISGIYKK